MSQLSLIGPAYGVQPVSVGAFQAYNRTGGTLTKGYVAQFDLAKSQAETTNVIIGDPASVWANMVAVASATPGRGVAVLLDDSLADNALGNWYTGGVGYVQVQKNSGDIAVGDRLVLTTAGYADADTSTGNVYIAIALEAVTGPSTATPALCQLIVSPWVNGVA